MALVAAVQAQIALPVSSIAGVADCLHSELHASTFDRKQALNTAVELAEAAIKAKDVKQARRCVETYFAEARRYGKDLGPVQLQDQFWCRAHYALSRIISEETKTTKGPELVAGCLESIDYLIKGLDFALTLPRYSFLLYDASVHFWHVSRPLHSDRLRQHLVPHQEKIVQALEKVDGQEEWRVRNLMNLVLCCRDVNRVDDALKHVAAATTLARSKNLPLLVDVLKLQGHLEASTGKLAAGGKAPAVAAAPVKAPVADPKKADPKKPAGKAPVVAEPVAAVKAVMSPDEEAALGIILSVASTKMDKGVAEQQLRAAWAKVDSNPQAGGQNANFLLVSRVGWCAAVVGLSELAEQCASRAAASQDVLPRVWSEMSRVLSKLKSQATLSEPPSSSVVQAHVQMMERLDDAITSIVRLRDVDGIHECCRLIWNAGLVLLQPNLRKHVKTTFAAAAKALEVVASPLHQLRAHLHLEIAKCEAADDSLLKASQEVTKGLALNYVVTPEEEARWQLKRPLDRFLTPMDTAAKLRSQEPTTHEEEAVFLIERSKESRSTAIRADYLKRAIEKLKLVPLPVAPEATSTGPERQQQQMSCRRVTGLWGDVVCSAWAGKMEDIVCSAAPYALLPQWKADVDKEMVMLQAEVSYIEAEAGMAALKKYEQEIVPPMEPAACEVGEDGARKPPETVEQLQHTVCEAIVRGMKLALDAAAPWLVMNGATLAWNSFLPILRQQRHAELRTLLEGVTETLLALPTDQTDGTMLASFSTSYAQALEHLYLLMLLMPPPAAANAPPSEEPSAEIPVPATPPVKGGASGKSSKAAPAKAKDDKKAGKAESAPPIDQLVMPNVLVRFQETDNYELLPKARHKAAEAALDVSKQPSAAAGLAYLAKGASVCEKTLAKLGNVQAQKLLEAYARLQQLQNLPPAVPGGSSQTSEQTSKVVKIIESLIQSVNAPAVKQEQEASEAISLLSSMAVVNVELWAKLARAAVDRKLWPAVIEAARSAAKVLPDDIREQDLESPADAPTIVPQSWFWLSVAKVAHGQAIMAVLRPGGQEMAASAQLRTDAIKQFVLAVKFASFVNKGDLIETAAQHMWNAAAPLFWNPSSCHALHPQLLMAVGFLNKCKPKNVPFQVMANCVLLESCMAACQWQEGLRLCNAAFKAVPQAHHQRLLEKKSMLLARIGQQVPEEMSRVGIYTPPVQSKAWQALAHESPSKADRVECSRKSIEAVKEQPWLSAEQLLDYAEWLYTCGPPGELETVQDALVSAAGHLVDLEDTEVAAAQNTLEDQDADKAASHGGNRKTSIVESVVSRTSDHSKAGAPSISGQRSLTSIAASKKKLAASRVGKADKKKQAPGEQWSERPSKLQAGHMEQLVRIFLLLSRATSGELSDQRDNLLAAHYYATRLTCNALQSAASAAAAAAAKDAAAAIAAATANPPAPIAVDGALRRSTGGAPATPAAKPGTPAPKPGTPATKLTAAAGSKAVAEDGITAMDATLSKPDTESTSEWVPSPDDLSSWAGFQLTPTLTTFMSSDKSDMAISAANIAVPELLLAYLEALSRDLQQHGYHLHAVPVCHLKMMVAKFALKSEGLAAAAALSLASLLEELAMPEAATAVERSIPDPSTLLGDEAAFGNDTALHALVTAAEAQCAADGGGRGRSATMSAGRLSFLGQQTGRPKSSRSRPGSREAPGSYAATGEGGKRQSDSGQGEEAWTSLLPAVHRIAAGKAAIGSTHRISRCLWLSPCMPHDIWLQKARFLFARGHYAPARELSEKALQHARARSNRDCEAQCLLLLAQLELWVRRPEEGVKLVQQAQEIGGDVGFWLEAITCYCACRLAGKDGIFDARDAILGGVQMFQALARNDPVARPEACAAEATLRLHHAQLEMQELDSSEGTISTSQYHQTLTATRQAAMMLKDVGLLPQHVLALLQWVDLMGRNPETQEDPRPSILEKMKMLQSAEQVAMEVLRLTRPKNLDPAVSLPSARLLAEIRIRLADLNVQLARCRDRFAAADRAACRPVFPSKSDKGTMAAVESFIDSVEDEEEMKKCNIVYEDLAISLATAAANLAGFGWRKAHALRVMGSSLMNKYITTVPPPLHPQLSTKCFLRVPVLPPPQEPPPPSASSKALARVSNDASTKTSKPPTTPNKGKKASPATPAPPMPDPEPVLVDIPTEPPSTPIEDTPEAKQALLLKGQAVEALQAAVGLAQQQRDWKGLQAAALELFACFGHNDPQQAAESLALAQTAKTAAALELLLERSTSPQNLEYLLQKQAHHLSTTLPLPGQNPHLQRTRSHQSAAGPAHRPLQAQLPPSQILSTLPSSLVTLVLHVSTELNTLYLAAFNVPEPNAPVSPSAQPAASDKKPPATPGKRPEPVQDPPRVALIDSMAIDPQHLKGLIQHVRSFRRALQKIIHDPKTPMPPTVLAPPPPPQIPTTLPDDPSAAAAAGSINGAYAVTGLDSPSVLPATNGGAGKEPPATPGTSGKTGMPNTKADKGEVVPPPVVMQEKVFSDEVNASWQWLLSKFQKFMEPLTAALRVAIPATDADRQQQVCLLLDMELATLPWESLSPLSSAAVGRCFSLHLLHSCLPPAPEPPTANLSRMSYIVDPYNEQSTEETLPPGPYNIRLVPSFKEAALDGVGKEWVGIQGQESRVPGDAEYQQTLCAGTGFVFYGLSRFLGCFGPKVLMSTNLQACDLAIILDRTDNETSRRRQQQADGRRYAATAGLETPTSTAALLLMRGVKCAVLNTAATTSWANQQLLSGGLRRLLAGEAVQDAVKGALQEVSKTYELDCFTAGTVVYGAAWMLVSGASGGKPAGKGGKK